MLGRSQPLRLKHYSILSPLKKTPPFDLIHAQFGVNGIKAIQAKTVRVYRLPNHHNLSRL